MQPPLCFLIWKWLCDKYKIMTLLKSALCDLEINFHVNNLLISPPEFLFQNFVFSSFSFSQFILSCLRWHPYLLIFRSLFSIIFVLLYIFFTFLRPSLLSSFSFFYFLFSCLFLAAFSTFPSHTNCFLFLQKKGIWKNEVFS